MAPTSELHFLLISIAFGRQPNPFLVVPLAVAALYAGLPQAAARFGNSAAWAATGKRLEAALLPRQVRAWEGHVLSVASGGAISGKQMMRGEGH